MPVHPTTPASLSEIDPVGRWITGSEKLSGDNCFQEQRAIAIKSFLVRGQLTRAGFAACVFDVDTQRFSLPEVIHTTSFDKRSISGFLYRPPAKFTGKRPVIIDIHGGPEEQYRPTFGYDQNYFLNELGAVKIYPNVRGSSGYGKNFLKLDDGLRREDAV